MDIVIVGDGKVGFTLASQLDHEGHNVSLDDFDFETTLSSVYTCLGNVGPGLGLCGPASLFAFFSPLSKITLSFCMLLGRLEIYPILIFLLPIMTLTQKKKVKIGKVDYN
ncbi:potassium transporter TrkG [Dubosiella newyorkensis]|jgi:trk system potassium uptake protein TrkH|uniref:potassium transporter TrkG n=1 Tax=Dubosiella newyorkensis TaxID=1862672 RepID=UPI0023542434|nr:potassium transporter TrkG [Dubosiella newyorkensis]MCI9040556.1 hypothetical protein [Dubosiella newyorkensis]